ncbi:MAG: hypothetical protein A2Y38_01235 [Spirochaetes bacterium GWB1_59_5]|nr:MAG: hypothetical protein A2Y38_01235 [Spirochaetes bacterium GWB1_59_5]
MKITYNSKGKRILELDEGDMMQMWTPAIKKMRFQEELGQPIQAIRVMLAACVYGVPIEYPEVNETIRMTQRVVDTAVALKVNLAKVEDEKHRLLQHLVDALRRPWWRRWFHL